MTPEQFCYWLQGFIELTVTFPTDEQWTAIKNHLNTVFDAETPEAIARKAKEILADGKALKKERRKELMRILQGPERPSDQNEVIKLQEEFKKLWDEEIREKTKHLRAPAGRNGRIC